MTDWPVNERQCDHEEGCDSTDTTPCFYVLYKHDLSVLKALFEFGPCSAWRLWCDGHVDVLDGYYCPEHAYEEGFCWACGNFYAGASERFDFRIEGQDLCDGCWSNCRDYGDEFDDDYYPGPWDD